MLVLLRVVMHIAIHFNHKLEIITEEIGDVRPDRMLTAELNTEPLVAEDLPQKVFSLSGLSAHLLSTTPMLIGNVRPT